MVDDLAMTDDTNVVNNNTNSRAVADISVGAENPVSITANVCDSSSSSNMPTATTTTTTAAAAAATSSESPSLPPKLPAASTTTSTTTTTTTTMMMNDTEIQTSNHVYLLHPLHSWIPARVLEINPTARTALVSIPQYNTEQAICCDGGRMARSFQKETISYANYPNHATLPLQNVDEDGRLKEVQDMVDLPFLHEVRCLVLFCLGWDGMGTE